MNLDRNCSDKNVIVIFKQLCFQPIFFFDQQTFLNNIICKNADAVIPLEMFLVQEGLYTQSCVSGGRLWCMLSVLRFKNSQQNLYLT